MKNRQDGFTIMEVMISVVILGIVLTTLAGLVYASAVQAVRAQDTTTRTGITLEMVNRYSTLPFANLTSGCQTTGKPRAMYNKCATVVNNSGNQRTVTITVKPLQRDTTTETVVFIRSLRNSSNPLCVGC